MSLIFSPASLLKGVKTRFMRKYVETRTDLLKLATTVSSDTDLETYAWMNELPNMREFLTERRIVGLGDQRYEILNRKFEQTLGVQRDHLSDGKTQLIQGRINEMAALAKGHPLSLMTEQLVNGIATTVANEDGILRNNACADGGAFFSNAHPAYGLAPAQSNLLAGSGTSISALTADLGTIRARFARILDAGGRAWRKAWGEFVIVAPPELEIAFETILKATQIDATDNIMKGKFSLVTDPGLVDTEDWYVLHTGGELKPLVFQEREPVEFASLDDPENNESAFMREIYYFGTRYRGAGAYGFWQDAQKVNN